MAPFSLTWKRVLNGLGAALAIVGVAFVGIRFRAYSKEIDFDHIGNHVWVVVAAAAVAYAMAGLLLAAAWRELLCQMDVHAKRLWAVKVYGISQLAKYVPGNIFQFAGRQALGMAGGAPGWVLAKSTIWELGLLALAGLTYGGLALPLVFGWPVALGGGIFFVTVVVVAWMLGRGFSRVHIRPWILYLLFHGVSSLLFIWLLISVAPERAPALGSWAPIGAAYIVAWLAGLVTPGAPAGVGVRELVLMFLMHGQVPEADLLLAVVVGRIVTVGGDAIFFLGSSLLPTKIDDSID